MDVLKKLFEEHFHATPTRVIPPTAGPFMIRRNRQTDVMMTSKKVLLFERADFYQGKNGITPSWNSCR